MAARGTRARLYAAWLVFSPEGVAAFKLTDYLFGTGGETVQYRV